MTRRASLTTSRPGGGARYRTAAAAGLLACALLPAVASLPGSAAAGLAVARGALTSAAPQLHVSGNKLVSASGVPVRLHGTDRSGTEYMCVQGYGIFDGPADQASITAMKAWNINAVRVPLNEACWDGEPYVQPGLAGSNYQNAIEQYVRLLNANGLVAILDLHWSDGSYSGCSSAQAVCEKPMPDANAVTFWRSVAAAFRGNNAVVFDLFNEPFPDQVMGSGPAAWRCWLNGGTSCQGFSYPVAGMQSLVNAVRSTGAANVIMLGGLSWANDLSSWLAFEPTDPAHNLVASWHSYNFNACNGSACWSSRIAPVIARVPLIAGEIGENDCAASYITPLMSWLDARSAGYLAWTWDTWPGGCGWGPTLITSYDGTPTPYGAGYRSHLLTLPRT